ncbi:MAG: phage integrase central domain-containing protein [Acidimicrobiales bacterium]
MVASVRSSRAVGVRSSVSDLLEAWFAVASTGWAPTTTRQTRSVLDRYLHPHLGGLAVGEVTPAIIDAVTPAFAVGEASGDARWRRALWLVFTRCCGPRSGGDAVGMDLGQPGRARSSHRCDDRRASTTDS